MKIKDSFHPYAMLTIVFWALAFVLTRLTLAHFSVYALGFLRYAVASCVLALVVIITRARPPRIADAKWFLLTGVTGFAFYMIAFNKGCETVTAATSSLVLATTPVTTALLARFIHKERLSARQWAAIGIAFAGVALLTALRGGLTVNTGLIWLLAASLGFSVYNLIQRRVMRRYSALQATAYSVFAGTLLLGVFLPAAVRDAQSAPGLQLLWVAVMGVFSSALGFVSWAKAFSKAEYASSVTNYMFVTPFLTALLGFLLAGETPELSTLLGGAVILLGLLLFNFPSRREGAAAP